MVHNRKIYTDANDLGVSGRVFYTKTASGTTTLYTDTACTVAAEGGDVFQAYLAGNLTIVYSSAMYVPTSLVIASSTVKADILTVSSGTATVVTCQAAIASGDTKTAADYAKIIPAT